MNVRIPPLKIIIVLESNLLKSITLVRRSAVIVGSSHVVIQLHLLCLYVQNK